MANNPYVNKVQTADGTTIIDISDTTAVASDVALGKYFYTAQGQKVQGSSQGGGGGYVTQDANGYIVLPSTGGGGSSDTWSWMGKNPTIVKDYGTTKAWLKDTGYATWTPSTTATIVTDYITLDSYTGANFSDYDYITLIKFHAHLNYGTGATGTNQIIDTYYAAAYNSYGIFSSYNDFITDTVGSATSGVISTTTNLIYYNSSGVLSRVNGNYGVYVSSNSYPTLSFASGTITPKTPRVSANCNASYFTTTNAGAVNQDTSYYERHIEIYRIDIHSNIVSALDEMRRDIYVNGV